MAGTSMQVELKILRYDPERDAAPHWETYSVVADPMDRVLDLLHKVKFEQDGTLTFRRSCAHGVCGSDAMLINGRTRMACSALVDRLVEEHPDGIELRPMSKFPVVRDLAVDRSVLFENLKAVKAWVPIDGTYDLGWGPKVSLEDQEKSYPLSRCISCCW